jgi:S1-C subfamily serine protease
MRQAARPSALTTPVDTVDWNPNGLPIAITSWPTRSDAASPSVAKGRFDESARHNLSREFAVEVISVVPNSPAGQGGIRKGDLIVTVNGTEVSNVDHVHQFLSDWPIGKPVKITLLRGQERLEIEVTPSEAWT